MCRSHMDPGAPKSKILVVDDNADNRALAQATLEDADHEVLVAGNGEDALRLFDAEHPDCVLLDVRMPGMDGFTACARLRALPGGADVPIVFLTALRDIETFDRALRAGGDDFVTKPVAPAELVARVHAALKLRRMSSELREHYALARSQRDDLMRLQLQKERLTAFVVHDLKNPVNSMDLNAQMLLRDEELSASARESIRRIREEARALLRLVLNLLDISKSEEGQLVPRRMPIALDDLLHQVQEEHAIEASNAGVSLSCAVAAPVVSGDADLLRRVLENLVENAIRHAPEGTEVLLRSIPCEGAIELHVADAGPGVSPELRERIFERFVQLECGDRVVSRSGRGLGLAFCKLAVEAHGGEIRIEDGNPGSVFCVRLPHASR